MANFSDNFNRADGGLGANWTNVAGGSAAQILSNRFAAINSGYAENTNAYTGTACDSINQYVKATLVFFSGGFSYAEFGFRITDSSSPMYGVFFWLDEDQITIATKTTPADTGYTSFGSAATTIADGQTWGITLSGTGNDLTVRGWLNPTNNTPDSATSWDSDTSPDIVITANPSSAVDSGNYVGLGGEQFGTLEVQYDNFFGGDIPTSGTYTVVANSGTYNLNGQATSLLASHNPLAANQGSYSLTGQDATLSYDAARILNADVGLYTLIGSNALVDVSMNAASGSYTLTGQDVTLTYQGLNSYSITAEFGSYALNGQTVGLLEQRKIFADFGQYNLTGVATNLIWSGAPASGTGGPNRGARMSLSSIRLGL